MELQEVGLLHIKTPRGGLHLYFKYKKGLKNKANYIDGVDIRTDGGLIVLPHSEVKNESVIGTYNVVNNSDILEMPQAYMYNKCYFKPPLTDEEVEKKVESVLRYALPPYCDGKGNIDNWKLVNHVLATNPSYNKGNLYYLYDSEKGYYRYMDSRKVQTMFFKYAINDKEKTANKAKNYSELLMLVSENAGEIYDEKQYINCLNGIIDIKNDKLIGHSSKYKLQVQFQANYIEEWKEKFEDSDFKKYLYSTLDEGTIITLQESWGLMLSPHAKEVQNCFIYKGEGANGKSLAFEIQEALIGGNEHVCSIGLGDFGGDFVILSAEGKHVNIVRDDELSGKKVNKAFKSMCCGEPVQVNRKNKDIIRLGFNMTMFFGLNTMPESDDNSVGFFRRPIIIPFNNSFGTSEEVEKGIRDKVKDPNLANRIIKKETPLAQYEFNCFEMLCQ